MKKRWMPITAVFLSILMISTTTLAETYDLTEYGEITVTGGSSGSNDVSWANGTRVPGSRNDTTEVIITSNNNETEHTVTLNNGAEVTLKDVNIVAPDNNAGITVNGNDNVINLEGEHNYVQGGDGKAGVNVGAGSSVTIDGGGDGMMIATGGENGAGIGGNSGQDAGAINVEGAGIRAIGGDNAAGIGGGKDGSGGQVTLEDSNVQVTGGKNADGIGAGQNETNKGTVTVTNSNVDSKKKDGTVDPYNAIIETGSSLPGTGSIPTNGSWQTIGSNEFSGTSNQASAVDIPGDSIPQYIIFKQSSGLLFIWSRDGVQPSNLDQFRESVGSGWYKADTQVVFFTGNAYIDARGYTGDSQFQVQFKVDGGLVYVKPEGDASASTRISGVHYAYGAPAPTIPGLPTITPKPTPTATPAPTPEATPTPTPEGSPTPIPEGSPTPTPEATPTPTPEATPTPTPEATSTPTPTVTPTPTSDPPTDTTGGAPIPLGAGAPQQMIPLGPPMTDDKRDMSFVGMLIAAGIGVGLVSLRIRSGPATKQSKK